MDSITTFVILDTGTTGLPIEENNMTKLTRLDLLAVPKEELERATTDTVHTLLNNRRSFHIDPETEDQPFEDNPTVRDIFQDIYSFLNSLPRPVCLVAHNGNGFDYPILLVECHEINERLPEDLLCVDSLVAFRGFFYSEEGYGLRALYANHFGTDVLEPRYRMRSEMLLDLIVAFKNEFLPWAEINKILLTDIVPLARGV